MAITHQIEEEEGTLINKAEAITQIPEQLLTHRAIYPAKFLTWLFSATIEWKLPIKANIHQPNFLQWLTHHHKAFNPMIVGYLTLDAQIMSLLIFAT